MTKEEMFRAIGEVREDQIEGAEIVKKQNRRLRRRLGALAACLALVLTATAVSPWGQGQIKWKAILYSFNPGVEEADAGGGDMDGSRYWTENPSQPVHPNYSANVEIGQLPGVRYGNVSGMMSLDAKWLSEEELFAQDTVIFRGTVQELQYYRVELDAVGMAVYFTKALVEATDPIRGNLTEGETVSLLWLGAKSYMTTSLSGPLEDINVGSDAIFMPVRTDRNTGWREDESYFCYADLADFYLSEGARYVFANVNGDLEFDQSAYPSLAEAGTLDGVAAYIREMTGDRGYAVEREIGSEFPEEPKAVWVENGESVQPAAEPAAPQTALSKTAQAVDPSSGPRGAREASSGTVSGGKSSSVSP